MTTKKIISSAYEPDRNELWLDCSDGNNPTLKTYANGKWDRVQASSATDPNVPYATVSYVVSGLSSKADLVGGKVPSTQLPSYVDDVIEGTYDEDNDQFSVSGVVVTPESGKIYISTDTDYQYRWSGSTYSRMNEVNLTNYVTTYSTQTVSGDKTFSGKLRCDALYNSVNDNPILTNSAFGVVLSERNGNSIISKAPNGATTIYGNGGNSSMIYSTSTGNHYQVAGVDYFNTYNNQLLVYKPIISTDALSATSLTATGLTSAGIVTNTSAGVMGTTATVPIANGGTNATTAASALTNLGLIDNSSSGYFDIGTMRIQWGTISTASGVSVTLPAAFANNTYSLTATANTGSTSGSGTVQISSKTTTTFTPIKIYVASGGGVSAMGEPFCYIAIGLKP